MPYARRREVESSVRSRDRSAPQATEFGAMTAFGPLPSIPPGIVASAAGSVLTGTAERAAKSDAAAHSVATGRKELSTHPLDADANASADRDADGWNGGTGTSQSGKERDLPQPSASPPPQARPRLPDDPCGGRLDVTA
jgi:hypothetical protein